MLRLFIKQNSNIQLVPRKVILFCAFSLETTCHPKPFLIQRDIEIEKIVKVVNNHPYPDIPLRPTLVQYLATSSLSTPLVENVLGRLFAAHSNGLKSYEFFKFCIEQSQYRPSSDAFEKTLHILARMRYFDKAWELMEEIKRTHSYLLTHKSMSILLSRIAKFHTYEDTLEAFERMEKKIFVGKKFGTDEFNVLLRAFCTQRLMKEARSVFHKLHPRFTPDAKTMNILLLGFKESGDVTAVELFYHEMVRRGFKPNNVTYNIRIDAFCKKRCFLDGLRLLNEMEQANCSPTLETITTLIHGAGVARNRTKAIELFEEISKRKLKADIGAYNALISSLVRCRDVSSAADLMDEMLEKGIGHDNITYHTMFLGLMRSKGLESVIVLHNKMINRKFVPKTRTVVMLIKYYCENRRVDLGLDLWNYLLDRGHCPHGHALDLLVTSLCSQGRVREAFECSKQLLERGRFMSEAAFRMVERFLLQAEDTEKISMLDSMMKRLQNILPPTEGQTVGFFLPSE